MAFSTRTFPFQADFGQTVYWIGDVGPFQYGEAVTAFFASELTANDARDELLVDASVGRLPTSVWRTLVALCVQCVLRPFCWSTSDTSEERAPHQCRLCRRWFLHVPGEKFLYCENVAPRETEKICREVGARASFEQKVQSDDAWKFYKRAYKKYYARVMKGNMTRDEFNAWVEHTASERDFTYRVIATCAV